MSYTGIATYGKTSRCSAQLSKAILRKKKKRAIPKTSDNKKEFQSSVELQLFKGDTIKRNRGTWSRCAPLGRRERKKGAVEGKDNWEEKRDGWNIFHRSTVHLSDERQIEKNILTKDVRQKNEEKMSQKKTMNSWYAWLKWRQVLHGMTGWYGIATKNGDARWRPNGLNRWTMGRMDEDYTDEEWKKNVRRNIEDDDVNMLMIRNKRQWWLKRGVHS